MAANLAAAGYRVLANVRRTDAAPQLRALGLEPTTDLADLFGCATVITMLPDDDVVLGVALGRDARGPALADGLATGAIHLSMSTISTTAAARLAAGHARKGQGYVAAPVFGNPDAARERQLFILAAGAEADVVRCQPLLDAMGQETLTVGAEPWHANLVKLMGNTMTATALEVMSETVSVFIKRGLDPKTFLDIMTGTMFGGRAHKIYGDRIIRHAYDPGFIMPLVLKDMRLALAEAEAAGSPMPSAGVVHDRLITAIARGHADLDWSALGLVAAEEAGIGLAPTAAAAVR
jgi:3-hydroxyisobutyrate dehydrogenase-like beta-hydroxyacid dehydrogenase